MNDFGILAIESYIPARRIERQTVMDAMAWTTATSAGVTGTRSFAGWDEDSITLAVTAGRRVLPDEQSRTLDKLALVSTTLPFADRSNGGVVREALRLSDATRVQDTTGSQRAGTTALIDALSNHASTLIIASDKRRAAAGSPQELHYGHGAVACRVGQGRPILRLLGGATVAADMVDHYRASSSAHDYSLEARWVRDEGHVSLIPKAVSNALIQAGVDGADVNAIVLALPAGSQRKVSAACPTPNAELFSTGFDAIGDIGVAHPLWMLGQLVAQLGTDDIVVVCGFGQGGDALILQRTQHALPASTATTATRAEPYYSRFLAVNGELHVDGGMRAERDNRTAHSTHFRRRDAINGFVGGLCQQCKTPQFPRARVCVSCQSRDDQVAYEFSHRRARVKSFTEDWQAYTASPPLVYGNVAFAGGGNVYMEFTDVEAGELAVGDELTMSFRIKDIDRQRGFHRYFWKATPMTRSS